MKGLIIKDLLTLKSYLKMLLIMIVLLFGMGIVTQQIDFFLPVLLVICPMVGLVTFSYDQSSNWNTYGKTLPISNRQFVLSKYVASILFLIVGLLLITVLSLLVGKGLPDLTFILVSIGYTLFMLALLFPITYKIGPEKTRLMVIAILMIPSILMSVLGEVNFSITESQIMMLIKTAPFVGLVFLCISYYVSVSIFAKKEF